MKFSLNILLVVFMVALTSTGTYCLEPTVNKILFSERWIESNKAQLFCRTMGRGKPLIVLHGGPGLSQNYLLPQLYKLAENNFVIFYDQRGCGQSTGEINVHTIDVPTFVNDLETLRKAFHLETISILGHSWGGFLAMEYAIAYPDAVDKLILTNSIPSSSDGFALYGEERVRRIAPYLEEIDAMRQTAGFQEGDPELMEHYFRTLFRAYCHHPENADHLNVRMSATAALNGMRVLSLMHQNAFQKPFNLQESLKTLDVPTLIIHGDDDIIPYATAQAIHECIKGSLFVFIKNCGHFPYVEEPDVFFDSIKGFLLD